ncbi:MAG TPA: carboxypeptidase regulatory-like domain-containing protein [Bryobacteraceae bacterium]|nr:carboxypeptidase regulatory-like domain-containing protein [Bryobacteraceae bacterium]
MLRTAVFCLLASQLGALFAQTTGSATIVGTVTDNTGAVIPGAKVIVVSPAMGFNFEGITNNEGYFLVPYLRPGAYNLTVESQGFKKYVRTGIELRTNAQPRIDVALEVGSVADSVEVEAAAPLLETETTISGGIMEGKTIVKIPVMQKLTFRILPYLPNTQVINGLHLNGQRERSMGYNLDGLGAKEPVTGAVGSTNRVVTSSIDAVSEVKAYATGMPAEFGHTAGGGLSVVFRSGSNQFHGSGEDRFINNVLLHRDYFDLLKPPTVEYHEISAVLSGPVFLPKIYNGKDRTFWLFGFARHHENASETFIGDVPSPGMLNGDFNFLNASGQQVGNIIYDPTTMRQNANGTWTSDPFPGNTIPKNRFDPVTNNFLAQNPFTPANQAPGFLDRLGPHQNLIAATKYQSYRTRFDIKIDHSFSSNHKLFARYSQGHHTAFRDRWVNEANWRLIDPNAIPFPIDQPNIVVSDTYTISPTLISEFRLGFNRRKTTKNPDSTNGDWAKQLGIPGVSGESFPFFATSANTAYYRTGPGGVSSEVWEDMRVQENITKVLGKHTIKFGVEIMKTRYNILSEALPSGRYLMGGTQLPFATAGTTGNDFADLLLGNVNQAQFTRALATWLPRWWSNSAYIQDDFKPMRNLTINYGVRWSYESPFQTKYGQQSQFDPTVNDPLTGRLGAIVHRPGPLSNSKWTNFQPRVGFAYNFRPKLVFRGNFGLISQDLFMTQLSQNFEEYLASAAVQSPVGDPRPAFKLSQGPGAVNFNIAPDGSAPFVGTNYSSRNVSWIDPNIRMPYIMNWSAGFQYELRPNLLVEVMYQGSSGVGLLNNWDINVVPLNIASDYTTLDNIRRNVQNFKPYPQFGQVQLYSNFGHNSYHSGTVRMERRYQGGFFVNGFYTWSKAITDADADGNASGVTYYNRRLEKARANYDISHRFVGTFVYELPYGKGRRWGNSGGWKNAIVGGWELMFSQTLQSGPPITVSFAGAPTTPTGGNPYVWLPGALRPNQVLPNDQAVVQDWTIGGNRLPTAAQNPYLNAAAFAYPDPFTPGTLGRNTLTGPGMVWGQASLSKSWVVKERLKFTARWDCNNPYKHINLGDPNRVYNATTLNTFGRFTGTRGSFSDVGGRLNNVLVGRFEW